MTASDGRDTELLALADRIKMALSGEIVLTGEACKHGWDRAVCVMKGCDNPYDIDTLLKESEAFLRSATSPSPADSPGREELITLLARNFRGTFTPFGNGKNPNALAGNVIDAILARLAAKPAEDGVRSLQQRIHMLRVTLSSVVTLANGGGVNLKNLNAIGKAAKFSLDRDALSPPTPTDRK